jgi:hypothetical protein
MNHNLNTAIILGLMSGELRFPTITDNNRIRTERAPEGSALEAERIAAA